MTGELPTADNIDRLRQVERTILRLIEMKRENNGRLPLGVREEATKVLQVSVRTIDYWVARYQESGLTGLIRYKKGRL
jgi:hypothetical protein